MSDRETITPEKRAAIIDGIQRTGDPEVLRYSPAFAAALDTHWRAA